MLIDAQNVRVHNRRDDVEKSVYVCVVGKDFIQKIMMDLIYCHNNLVIRTTVRIFCVHLSSSPIFDWFD